MSRIINKSALSTALKSKLPVGVPSTFDVGVLLDMELSDVAVEYLVETESEVYIDEATIRFVGDIIKSPGIFDGRCAFAHLFNKERAVDKKETFKKMYEYQKQMNHGLDVKAFLRGM